VNVFSPPRAYACKVRVAFPYVQYPRYQFKKSSPANTIMPITSYTVGHREEKRATSRSGRGLMESILPCISPTRLMDALHVHIIHGVSSTDWEYPSSVDRGGVPADAENYVLLLNEIRETFVRTNPGWEVTITLPFSYCPSFWGSYSSVSTKTLTTCQLSMDYTIN
jgi:hypothetical protein